MYAKRRLGANAKAAHTCMFRHKNQVQVGAEPSSTRSWVLNPLTHTSGASSSAIAESDATTEVARARAPKLLTNEGGNLLVSPGASTAPSSTPTSTTWGSVHSAATWSHTVSQTLGRPGGRGGRSIKQAPVDASEAKMARHASKCAASIFPGCIFEAGRLRKTRVVSPSVPVRTCEMMCLTGGWTASETRRRGWSASVRRRNGLGASGG